MLRLVKTSKQPHELTLLVEGRVVAPWLGVLEEECRQGLLQGLQVTVDLSGVTYVGPAGIAVLRELVGQGVQLSQLSPILAELVGPSS